MSEAYTDLLALSTSDVMLQVPVRRLELASMLIIDASEADLAVMSVMIKKRKKCIKATLGVLHPTEGLVESVESVESVEEEKAEVTPKEQARRPFIMGWVRPH